MENMNKSILEGLPNHFINSYKKWCDKLNVKTESLINLKMYIEDRLKANTKHPFYMSEIDDEGNYYIKRIPDGERKYFNYIKFDWVIAQSIKFNKYLDGEL